VSRRGPARPPQDHGPDDVADAPDPFAVAPGAADAPAAAAGWDDLPAPAVAPTDGRTPVPGARSIRRYTAQGARRRAPAGIGAVLGDVYYAVVT